MTKYDKALFQNDIQQLYLKIILAPIANESSALTDTLQENFESLLHVHVPIKTKEEQVQNLLLGILQKLKTR